MKGLVFVGELNPYGADPSMALFHLPRHASGNRLREHLGLRDATYHALHKVNLCIGRWSMRDARRRAAAITSEFSHAILLGAKVAAAFDNLGFFNWRRMCAPMCTLITLPHPSGLNRMWNEPGVRDRARQLLRDHLPEIPWGEADA